MAKSIAFVVPMNVTKIEQIHGADSTSYLALNHTYLQGLIKNYLHRFPAKNPPKEVEFSLSIKRMHFETEHFTLEDGQINKWKCYRQVVLW